VSRYQKGKTSLDFIKARDSEWQWHQLGHMQVCTLLQTDNHASTPPLSFFTGRMPFMPPNQQCQSTEGNIRNKYVYINAVCENKPSILFNEFYDKKTLLAQLRSGHRIHLPTYKLSQMRTLEHWLGCPGSLQAPLELVGGTEALPVTTLTTVFPATRSHWQDELCDGLVRTTNRHRTVS